MDKPTILTSLAVHDAAEALTTLGSRVRPVGEHMEVWEIGDSVRTDEELIGLAARRGIRLAAGKVQ